ncbi:MAG: hypothetical protein HZA54_09220 [Planctomycetes bacterium]|nr:hypothetical protein [Planctomycetota bacterium]
MTRVHFVGDGPRDETMLPPLVENLLSAHHGRKVVVTPSFAGWARLHARGYPRKVLFACQQAADECASGLVATVDRDKSPGRSRLRDLHEGRAAARAMLIALPIALGEADPHAEAWLVADAATVCHALDMPADAFAAAPGLPPKDLLEHLWQLSPQRRDSEKFPLDLLRHLAAHLSAHVAEAHPTCGFRAFAAEVRSELGPIT